MSITLTAPAPVVADGEPVIAEQSGAITIGLLKDGRVFAYVPMTELDVVDAAIAALTDARRRLAGSAWRDLDVTIAEAYADALTAEQQSWLTTHPLV